MSNTFEQRSFVFLLRYNAIGPVRTSIIWEVSMDKPAQNIQDSFLNNARKEKGSVTIYLLSGVKLSGRIRSFDKYSLVLETNNQEQLIFKHAISTVVTARSVQHSPHSANNQSTSAAQAVGTSVTSEV